MSWCSISFAIASYIAAVSGLGGAQPVGEQKVHAAVLVLVGNCEREHFLLFQVGKAFHGGSLQDNIRILLNYIEGEWARCFAGPKGGGRENSDSFGKMELRGGTVRRKRPYAA